MKNFKFLLTCFTALTIMVATNVAAQDIATDPQSTDTENVFSDEYLTHGQGESPVASGKFTTLGISRNGNNFHMAFGPINGYFTYQWSDVLGISGLNAGPSAGIFSGVPWVGPIVTYSLGPIEVLAWPGISAGDAPAGELKSQVEVGFLQADVKLNITDNLYTSFTYLDFGGDFYLQTIGGEVPIGENLSIFGSTTYDIGNEKLQFFLGAKITGFLSFLD